MLAWFEDGRVTLMQEASSIGHESTRSRHARKTARAANDSIEISNPMTRAPGTEE